MLVLDGRSLETEVLGEKTRRIALMKTANWRLRALIVFLYVIVVPKINHEKHVIALLFIQIHTPVWKWCRKQTIHSDTLGMRFFGSWKAIVRIEAT